MAPVHRSETKNLISFLAIVLAWSWLAQLPRILASAGRTSGPLAGWLSLFLGALAAFGPFVAAFGLTYWNEGAEGVRHLWQRGWERRFQRKWLAPALLLAPVLAVLTVLLVMLARQNIDWAQAPPLPLLVPVFCLILFTSALPEEFGWRGYALDRFQLRSTALVSSLTLGVLWALWQLPLHFIAGTMQEAMPVWMNVLHTAALSVIYTWLYNNSRGSVLMVVLFHTVTNLTAAVVPTWTTDAGQWIGLALWMAAAGAVVVIWRPARLLRKEQNRAAEATALK